MKTVFLAAAIVLTAGCVTAKPTYLPDGRSGHSINCSGTASSWAACETKAGDTCKTRGYDVISATQDGQPFLWGSGSQVTAGATINRTLLIACK